MSKTNLPAITPVFRVCHMSHDPSEIILICWYGEQETFIFINNVETTDNHA